MTPFARATSTATGATMPGGPGFSRRRLLQVIGLAGGLAVAGPALAACSPDDESDGAGRRLDSLTVALPSSISTLDVTREAGIINYVIALLCLEGLTAIGADGALAPSLATAWTQPDPLTYVYKLRPDVTFSDGNPLTADDVIASIEVNSRKGSTSALAYAYAPMKSVKATADDEITFTLSTPTSGFGWVPSPSTLQVSSRAFLDEHGDKVGTPQALLLGTGPYVVTEFAPDSHVVLERNDAWWGGRVEVAKVRLDFITDENTRLLAMRDGSVDIALSVPPNQVKDWQAIDGVSIETATDNSLVTLAFNTSVAPWSDPKVRTAVAHCIDRPAVVESVLRGNAEVALTIPTTEQWGGLLTKSQVDDLYASIPQVDFDLDAAASLLAESSVPDGFSATLTYPNSGPLIGRALLTLAENLKGLGIDLKVQEITLEQWIADLGKHAGIAVGWYFPGTGDPAEYVQLLLNGAYAESGGTNLAEYRNAEVTALLDQEVAQTDPAKRGDLLGQALVKAAADVAYQPLWWAKTATAFGPGLQAEDFGPYFFLGPWVQHVTTA
ncbi:ABC transporter substrate-binding protein [Nocardioides daeguensis]|uniref:ABC transporter substrate-binding protein n=1 Tax=Nocardioides daeguensis TaxID=908359 RepID=A0ABP6VRE3_9ACTN|nr:ABC transporter substrate-binding protein [Nocardioides daeguensis]MBV6727533.1 ABC transporter substrate-binding protein [Nocardioides daeguensis]MCR1773245.1 ABC transporter substrate-binding protein [Nocardioides daeguensis]